MRLSHFLAICLAAGSVASSHAATRTWTGEGTSNLWSDAGNWQGGVRPVNGDSVTTVPNIAAPWMHNDLGALELDSIAIPFDLPNLFEGDPITLTSPTPLTIASQLYTNVPFRFTSANPTINISSIGVKINGTLTLQGGTLTINAPNTQVEVYGAINELSPASIVANVDRLFIVGVANPGNFSGTLDFSGSWFEAFYNTMGTTAGATIIHGNSRVDVYAPDTLGDIAIPGPVGREIAEPLDLRTGPDSLVYLTTFDPFGSVDYTGPITLNGPQRFLAGQDIHLKGPVSGPGRLILDPMVTSSPLAPVTLFNSANSFSGGIEVRERTTLRAAAAGVVPSAGEVAIAASGLFDLQAYSQSPRSVTCAGTIAITLPASVQVSQASSFNGCTLRLTVPSGYVATGGVIPLVGNSSGISAGTFAALPEGSPFSVNGATYHISYRGGSGNDVVLVPAPVAPIPNMQDMWWAGAPGNGWGLSLVQHRDTLFGALYIYDANGKPTWLVMPGGAWDAMHTTYTGAIYTPGGAPFFAFDASRVVVGSARGSLTITVQDPDHAILDYTIDGTTGRKLITREVFAAGGATSPDRSDLWWGGLAQAGWGITILQQASTLFPIWYTYDASGAAIWYVMPDGKWTSTDTYEGHVYRTTGPPWVGHDYDPTKLQVSEAGTFRIRFNGDAAAFEYSVDGHSGSMSLDRQPF